MNNERRNFKPWYDDRADYNTNAKSYYDDLARKQKLIQLLAERIWEYEETLDESLEHLEQRLTDYILQNDSLMTERLENWDKRIDEMPEEMRSLFVVWLEDGTLEQIINHDVLGNKADKSFVDSEIERLEQKDENLTSQLEQTNITVSDKVKSINQANYSEMFKNIDFTHSGIIKRSDTKIELFAQNDYEGVRYLLTKDPTDEFFKLGTGGFFNNEEVINVTTTQGDGWETSGSANMYTTNIGDSFTIEYEGTGIDLRYYMHHNGGLWDIYMDGEVSTISTYSDESDTKFKPIRHPFGRKIIKGVFKGKDPNSDVASPRGWLRTGHFVRGSLGRKQTVDLLHESSNKEMAFRIVYQDNSPIWFPEHSGVGTMYDNVFEFYVNNENVTNSVNNGDVVVGDNVYVQQTVTGYDNVTSDKIANFNIQHSINKNGVIDFKGVMRPLTTFTMQTGYPLMLATNPEALNRVVTSYGNSKVNSGDETNYYFTEENGETNSVMFTTTQSGFGSYVAHATLNEATKTMRYGKEGTRDLNESLFFWQRENTPKFYFQAFRNKEFVVEDNYKWSGTIGVGRHRSIANYM